MVKYQTWLWTLVASVIFLSGFKKNISHYDISSPKSVDINRHVRLLTDPIKINIADAIVVQGNKGQKTVEVMVLLSKPSTETVTVQYNTKDKTAKEGVDYITTSGSIKFEPGEVSKTITVSIIGEVAADPDEDAVIDLGIEFWVHLNTAVGAIIDKADAIVDIMKNVAKDPRFKTNQSIYEVAIVFTGFLSTYGPTNLCGAKTNGTIVLYGLLKGNEYLDPNDPDDVVYTGTLNMMIMGMDLCSVTTPPNSDESRHCVIHVSGSGTVEAELEITYGTDATGKKTEGRGGYLKMQNEDGHFLRTVVSDDCDAEQVDDLWTKLPKEFFNFMSLPMILTRTLKQGVLTVTDDVGNKTTVNVSRKIR